MWRNLERLFSWKKSEQNKQLDAAKIHARKFEQYRIKFSGSHQKNSVTKSAQISGAKIRKLEEYCQLLWDWNCKLNLTRHTDYTKFVTRDLIDTLALSEFIRPKERILDVGSGGGVPGITLAILRPDLSIELCDSTGKKAFALQEMVQELRLDIPVHHAKAESLLTKRDGSSRFTTLTVRAVSRLVDLLRMVSPYWTLFDRLLLVKGPKWVEERGEARHYNLVNKLALRCLKKYPTQISETEFIESVILQLCRKDELDDLDKIIDERQVIKKPIKTPVPFRQFRKTRPA